MFCVYFYVIRTLGPWNWCIDACDLPCGFGELNPSHRKEQPSQASGFYLLLSVWVFLYVYLHHVGAVCAGYLQKPVESAEFPLDWGYRWLPGSMWWLEVEPMSSERTANIQAPRILTSDPRSSFLDLRVVLQG